MPIFDTYLARQSPFGKLIDTAANGYRIGVSATVLFVICLIATPFVIYWNFAHFASKTAPSWLAVTNDVWSVAFILSVGTLGILGLVAFFNRSED